jgi:transcriptional regulator with XRE-family HTH domain
MLTMRWRDLYAELPADLREEIEREVAKAEAAIELKNLRKARRLTQEELARRLGIRQANVSKMERRGNMHLSTLRQVVEAMGGELRVTAHFPDAEYRIEHLALATEE